MIVRRLRALVRVETPILVVAIGILAFVAFVKGSSSPTGTSLASYSTYDAGTGGYRALYEMLGKLGVRVERFERRPVFLDASIATLVYADPLDRDQRAANPTKADIAALEGWVRGGGALVYLGADDAAAKAGILHLPRVSHVGRARATVAGDLRARGVARLTASESQRFVARRKGDRVVLGDARGALVVAYAFGRGRIVAIVDRSLFTNAEIARDDRARLAYALLRPELPRAVVAFDETPHGYLVPDRWWAIVPRPFLIALGVALAALLVAIAGAALRLGPPLVPQPRDDRTSAEYVDAVASLFERNGEIRGTLVEASTSTTQAIARALGLDRSASNDEIAARIERDDRRASFRAMVRFATNAFADDANLVRGVALAQELRKEFTAHGRSRN